MRIAIVATRLPGRVCPPGDGFPGYAGIHVGVQRRNRPLEIAGLYPGDAESAEWTLECRALQGPGGADFTGPYVQGRPGGRFIYLSWGTLHPAGGLTTFRRAKIMLDAVGPALAAEAMASGTLTARLGLTDAKGRPLCAAVRPPLVEWSAAP
jgi:hypothetical protein